MKWSLFALGAIMIVLGGSCILSGYPIVEVERGWTLTISGAVAMTGGAVVVGLGILLTAVENLAGTVRDSLHLSAVAAAVTRSAPPGPTPNQRVATNHPREIAARDDSAASFPNEAHPLPEAPRSAPPPPRSEAPIPLASEERMAADPPPVGAAKPSESGPFEGARTRSVRTPAFLKRRGREDSAEAVEAAEAALSRPEVLQATIEPAPLDEDATQGQGEATMAPAPEIDQPAPSQDRVEPPRAAVVTIPELSPSAPRETATESPHRRFPIRSLTLPRGPWPQAPAGVAPPEAVVSAEEPAAPDESLVSSEPYVSAIAPVGAAPQAADHARREFEPVGPVGAPEQTSSPSAEDWFERALAGLEDAPEPADQPAVAPELEPRNDDAPVDSTEAVAAAQEPSEPAIIGRYETEGTLYVMYADGSIDAETATGIFRFESLAALKAHIENLS